MRGRQPDGVIAVTMPTFRVVCKTSRPLATTPSWHSVRVHRSVAMAVP